VEGKQLLFISGQRPKDYDADIETQIRQTFEQIDEIVRAAGGSMQNVGMIRACSLNMARDLPGHRQQHHDHGES